MKILSKIVFVSLICIGSNSFGSEAELIRSINKTDCGVPEESSTQDNAEKLPVKAIDALDSSTHACIFTAAQRCDPVSLKKLIAMGADVNAVDGYGQTPLMLALPNNDIPPLFMETIEMLIQAGADVNYKHEEQTVFKMALSTFTSDLSATHDDWDLVSKRLSLTYYQSPKKDPLAFLISKGAHTQDDFDAFKSMPDSPRKSALMDFMRYTNLKVKPASPLL